MYTRQDAIEELRELRARRAHLDRQIKELETPPPFPDGESGIPGGYNAVTFAKQYRPDGTSYTYVAVSVPAMNRWFSTGDITPRGGFTWKQLLDFVTEGNLLPNPCIRLLSVAR